MGRAIMLVLLCFALFMFLLFMLQLAFPAAHVLDDIIQFFKDIGTIIQGKGRIGLTH
jgi:hypothetical protein